MIYVFSISFCWFGVVGWRAVVGAWNAVQRSSFQLLLAAQGDASGGATLGSWRSC